MFAIELDPLYVDVAIRRWQVFTGEKATLTGGRSFDETANERGSKAEPSSAGHAVNPQEA